LVKFTNEGKRKKAEVKSLLNALAIVRRPFKSTLGHRGCGAAGELCKNPRCDKDPDSVLYWDSPEEENRQLKTSLNA
jgi:hypothetical protein